MRLGVLYSLSLCSLLLFCAPAWADSVSFSLRVPRVRDSANLGRVARQSLRSGLMGAGLEVRRSVRQGFRLKIALSIQEMAEAGDAPSCVILFRVHFIIMPQKRFVSKLSANGRASFNRAVRLDRAKRRKLRKMAMRYAIRNLVTGIKTHIARIKERMRNLPKGHKIGQAIRGVGGGGGRSKKAERGKPLNGRIPLLKMVPASFERGNDKPPTLESKKQ